MLPRPAGHSTVARHRQDAMDANTPFNPKISHCAGKERFATWDQAERVLRRRGKKSKVMRRHVYRCPSCRGWHVGSNSDE